MMGWSKTAEINRFPFLLSLDVNLSGSEVIADVTFGREAEGIAGKAVHYCIKQATFELKLRDAICSKVILVDPANIAKGVSIERTVAREEKLVQGQETEAGIKGEVSANPKVEVSIGKGRTHGAESVDSIRDSYVQREFSIRYYGDKKTHHKWAFEPFHGSCLRGSTKEALTAVKASNNKTAFIVEVAASINPKDIEPELHESKRASLSKLKERVFKWMARDEFDLTSPICECEISVSNSEIGNEVNAA